MCLGLAKGCRIQDGDRYILKYCGREHEYIAKETPNGIVLVHNSSTPLGTPMDAIPFSRINDYDFRRANND